MKKRRNRIIIWIAFVLSLVIIICIYFRKASINEILNNGEEIEYIYYMNGNNGDIREVRDYKSIQKIKDFFSSVCCIRKIEIMPSGGYSYCFTLVDKKGNEQKVMFAGNKVKINGKYYYIVCKSVAVETFIETLSE